MPQQQIEALHRLGPNQLAYCRQAFPHFNVFERQANAALQDTRTLREKYPVTHERKTDENQT